MSSLSFLVALLSIGAPPTCICKAINSTKLNITCSLMYADVNIQAINAKMNWVSNGKVIKTDTPVRALNNGYYTSTSVITVDASDPATYTCNVTFAKPTPQFTYIATNAPVFAASCNVTGKSHNVKCRLFRYLLKLTKLENDIVRTALLLSLMETVF